MAKLIVGRHTETVFNDEKIFSGCLDIPLSKKGINHAKRMVTQIEAENIDMVFVSSLFRSKETAAILMSEYYERKKQRSYPVFSNSLPLDFLYIPLLSDHRLNERSYGILEGIKKAYAVEKYGEDQVYQWRRSWSQAPPNGESLENVTNRVYSFLEERVFP